MRIVRKSNEQVRKTEGCVNLAKVRATTQVATARHKREDGFSDDRQWGSGRVVLPSVDVRAIRESLHLSQKRSCRASV